MTATAASPSRHRLHELAVSSVNDVGEDAIAVEFELPRALQPAFAFEAGQHVALQSPEVDDLRRSYSICSPVGGPLRVGIKVLPQGRFSQFVRDSLRPGDKLGVLPPAGRFVTAIDPANQRHVVGLAAGSGITPIYSIAASLLAGEPQSRCTLVIGNRTARSIMLLEDLADLKDRYPGRLQLLHVLSRESRGAGLLEGRIDGSKIGQLSAIVDPAQVSDWFVCGPRTMIDTAVSSLTASGVAPACVHRELFHADAPPVIARDRPLSAGVEVSMVLDGRTTRFTMTGGERTLLDGALDHRSDAPYACKGGVCGTCRCRLLEGEVDMEHSYALEADEIAAGIRLACQSVPTTKRVVVDFDDV